MGDFTPIGQVKSGTPSFTKTKQGFTPISHVKAGASAPKKEQQSVGGFLGNLAGDVTDAVVGLGPGLANVGKAVGSDIANLPSDIAHARPVFQRTEDKVVRPLASTYKDTYTPLFKGDLGAFGSQLYQHPLGPLLDLAAVASFGAGAAAKATRAAGGTGKLSRLDMPSEVTLESPAVKQGVKGGKTVTRPTSDRPLRKAQQVAADRFLKLFPADTPVIGEFQRFARELDRLPRREAQRLQLKLRPYQRAYQRLKEPERVAFNLIGRGVSPQEYKALLLREQAAGGRVEQATLKILDRADVRKAYENPSPRMLDAIDKGRQAGGIAADTLMKRNRLNPETVAERPYMAPRLARSEAPAGAPLEDALAQSPSVDQIKAQFAKEGRIDPFYLPDKATAERNFVGRAGGGFGVPRNPVHKTEGVIFRSGQLALEPDTLSSAYLGSVRYALHQDLHQGLLDSAVQVGKGEPLPKGYVYIRRPVGKGTTAEKIPYTQKTLGDFRDQASQLLPEEARQEFGTRSVGEAVQNGQGFYLAVPETFAKQATGQFLRSGRALQLLFQRPTQVWRALVLNLRPAWLVNNIVGNHLLYAIRYAGIDGLSAYVRAVREVGKDDAKFRKLVEEYVPEQVSGTFLNTQRPGGGRRIQNIVSGGLAPLDIGSEQMLRRAAVETSLRRDPIVGKQVKRMYRETGDFEQAAKQAFESDPQLARRVSDKVNDALGDFQNMSVFERQVLRQVFPFYGWYKAITLVTAKLPLDYPGRADLLAKVGQVGANETQQALGDIPSYLKGAIVVGADGQRARIVNSAPVNPYATVPQLGQDISGTVNPLAAGAARAVLGSDKYSRVSPLQALSNFGSGVADVGKNLPEVRLAQALTGNLYQGTPGKPTLYDRTPQAELLAFLGIPYRDVSLARARQLAAREKKQ